jgi:hypothetical protein
VQPITVAAGRRTPGAAATLVVTLVVMVMVMVMVMVVVAPAMTSAADAPADTYTRRHPDTEPHVFSHPNWWAERTARPPRQLDFEG